MPTPTSLCVVDLVTTDNNKKYEPAAEMALVIIEITREKGGCLPQDLHERGYLPAAVAEHWHMAQSLASVEIKLMASGVQEKRG